MRQLHSEIEINASAQKVWEILMDFEKYPDWNPFIRSIEGRAVPGAKLKVRIQPLGKKRTTFRPKVLICEPLMELRWLGRLVLPGVFDGEHIFKIESLGEDRVRFIQQEEFRGFLASILINSIGDVTEAAFVAMNTKLKERAESIG